MALLHYNVRKRDRERDIQLLQMLTYKNQNQKRVTKVRNGPQFHKHYENRSTTKPIPIL